MNDKLVSIRDEGIIRERRRDVVPRRRGIGRCRRWNGVRGIDDLDKCIEQDLYSYCNDETYKGGWMNRWIT